MTSAAIFNAKRLLLTVILFMVLTKFVLSYQNKYSGNANLDNTDSMMNQIRPFRMKKANLLWQYGRKQKLLSLELQTELFKELQMFDRLEFKLKKLKSENLDEDGAVEAKSLYSFKRLVEKYSLGDHLIEESERETRKIIQQQQPNKQNDTQIYFEDSTLQEMWREALNSGFTGEDLDLLKEEFTHQQMKIDEFSMMHNELLDLDDNDVEDHAGEELEGRISGKKRDKLDIRMGFHRLEQIAASMVSSDGEFQDARLNSLWNTANSLSWSQKKLSSFKEELHHFEKRLSKQKVYADKLQQSLQYSEHRHSPETHEFIENKHKTLTKEVKKLHTHLKERLSRAIKHTEL